LRCLFALASLIILLDFMMPGNIMDDEIIKVKKELQRYYNAAQNHHYSYKVVTEGHQFLVTENFARTVEGGEKIKFSVSRIFKEVNWYRLAVSKNKSFYSLRIVSGFVLPLLLLISIIMAYRYQKKVDRLIYILQILLIADLVLLST